MSRHLVAAVLLAACLVHAAPAQAQPLPEPPRAERHPKDVTVHGDRRIDDFFWLRERDNPKVRAYLEAEARYAAAWFQPLQGLEDTLYQEMLGRIQQADESVPARDGAWWYATRTIEGGQYPVHLRRRAAGPDRHWDPDAPEQVLLDLNRMAKGRKFLSIGGMSVSPDGRLLLFSTDNTGARDFLLQGKRIAGGQPLPLKVERAAAFEWAADSRTVFYVTTDATKRGHRLWRKTLGQRGPGTLLAEEKDTQFEFDLGHTHDRRYLVLASRSKDTTEIRVLDARHPEAAWLTVLPRQPGREYSLEHRDGFFYLLVNDTGRDFRLVRTPAKAPALERATELVAHRPGVMLEGMAMFRRHLVLQVRDEGAIKLRVLDFDSGRSEDVSFDEPVYSASLGDNREYDTQTLRFDFESLVTPRSVFDLDLEKRERTLRKRQPVKGGYDPSLYASERVWAMAGDATRVPVSLVYRRDRRRAGEPQPLLLYGYGSYGSPMDPNFSSARLSLLDRGVVFAIAHVRGGGDLGRAWYDDGKLARKMNTFTDFIAAAEALVKQAYTRPEQLVIEGGSAGGLLMGAVTNLRPELFHAVVAEVPFVDVINTMLDETIPLTTGEYIEWGDPRIEAQYRWMRAYSPYDNLRPGAYPAMLVRTSFNDSQVPYWEPAKWVAKLRTLKTDDHPLLLDINMDAGHGGASGRFDAMKERASIYAFMLSQWGLQTPSKAE